MANAINLPLALLVEVRFVSLAGSGLSRANFGLGCSKSGARGRGNQFLHTCGIQKKTGGANFLFARLDEDRSSRAALSPWR